ncbi:RNA-guided endonuclease InsQ/TnpB family protein [Nostoc sp.]|uniref:RNA-guided endonuclease InsQ/TnpB family protein n=1 Tax=Nostoc sp. TaxID=1180 RepID=UPI002FF659B7
MRSFKTELNLNNKQKTLCARHAGTSRHAYNWGLALLKELLNHNKANPTDKIKFPTAIDLHKLLVASVKVANPWYYEVSKCAPQEALRNLVKAFKRMRQVKGSGFPRFKKKNIRDSFYLEGSIKISGNKIKVPILGWVKCHEQLPSVSPSLSFASPTPDKSDAKPVFSEGRRCANSAGSYALEQQDPNSCSPKNVTISKRAGKWFIAFKLDTIPINNRTLGEPVGVDLGINVRIVG